MHACLRMLTNIAFNEHASKKSQGNIMKAMTLILNYLKLASVYHNLSGTVNRTLIIEYPVPKPTLIMHQIVEI